jgi:hypothetical protein
MQRPVKLIANHLIQPAYLMRILKTDVTSDTNAELGNGTTAPGTQALPTELEMAARPH